MPYTNGSVLTYIYVMKKILYLLYFLFTLFCLYYYVVVESPVAHLFNPFDGSYEFLFQVKLFIVVFFIDTILFVSFITCIIIDLKKKKSVYMLNIISLAFITFINAIHFYSFSAATANLIINGNTNAINMSVSRIYVYGIALLEIIASVIVLIKMFQSLKRKTNNAIS